MNYLIIALSSFLWRVRGGLNMPFTEKKYPLNKIWFALFYAATFCYLTQWNWNVWGICALAVLVSYQAYGWGEYIGCLICGKKPSERSDCDLVDDIVDNMQITYKGKVYKLTDYPILFGWVGLSLRGGIISFIIGLAFRNFPFMLVGLGMGTVYKMGGLIDDYIISDGKDGWRWAEWLFGAYLGLMLVEVIR